jgi:DNA polymerase-3 subunit beta
MRAALAAVDPAVASRSPSAALTHVLVADNAMTAADGELRISAALEGADCRVLLPAARLRSILASLTPGDTVTLTPGETSCQIKAGNGSWTLPTIAAEEFPAAPGGKAVDVCHLPGDQFHRLVSGVVSAADVRNMSHALAGVLVQFRAGRVSFVASDGRRMAIAEADVDQALDDSTTLCTRRGMDVVLRLSKGSESVRLAAAGAHLVAECDGVRVWARLLEGAFPRWRDFEPKPAESPARVVVGALLHTIRMAAVCASDTGPGMAMEFSADGLRVTTESAEYGKARAECDVVHAGPAVTVRCQPRYLTEWLSAMDQAETIQVDVRDGESAIVFRADEGAARNVVMPLGG